MSSGNGLTKRIHPSKPAQIAQDGVGRYFLKMDKAAFSQIMPPIQGIYDYDDYPFMAET